MTFVYLDVLTPPVGRSGQTTTRPSSRSTHSTTSTNTQSSSRTSTTSTISSSSSSYASTTSTSSSESSSSRKVLSTGARVGLGFGIVFFLLLCVMLLSYLKRRFRGAWEKVDHRHDEPAPSAPEGGYFPPSPRLDVTYPNSQYPLSAPAQPAALYYSPAYLIPYETSAGATMTMPLNTPQPSAAGASSRSNSTSKRTRKEGTKF
ncbi:hypothetical protein BDR04DRAFT_1086143 [Suillus decipiens]|nr:hypothetical protein BDR04DRAFT_1086143 [Suillus decipiens]